MSLKIELVERAAKAEAARDRKRERLGDEDIGLRVALAILEHELRAHDARDDDRRGTALDGLAHVLADALECIETFLLDLGRQHDDLDARKMLGQRLAARRQAARVRLHFLRRVGRSELDFVRHPT